MIRSGRVRRAPPPSRGRALGVALGALVVALVFVLASGAATAEGEDGGLDAAARPHEDANGSEGGLDADAIDPRIADLERTTSALRDFITAELPAEIEPQTLFDIPIGDDAAVALERARVGALLRAIDAEPRAPKNATKVRTADADADAVPTNVWSARVDLDRARLAFYVLPDARRHELIALHDKRKAAAGAPSETERRATEAEQRRDEALRSARAARTEAERLVSEEYARLLGVEQKQADFESRLGTERKAIAARRETTLVWQRRAREARTPATLPDAVDRTYDDLRAALRAARDGLDHALDEIASDASDVPQPGADPLADLRMEVETTAARDERTRVTTAATKLADDEKKLRDEQASQLLDEIDTLNRERLALLPFLSSDKRSAITGFTASGADQAASEVRQLTLIARYHRYAATSWLASLRSHHQVGISVTGAVVIVLEWFAAIGAFLWSRRRTPLLLQNARKRAQESDRLERRAHPSLGSRVIAFVIPVHRPVEWLGLAILLSWLVPAGAQDLLEVQLVTVIVQWILGGALVVVVVDALAGASEVGTADPEGSAALRLRSLRLVGRVVVAFGLVLVLTSRLVGPGTIYRWVLSTCWIASIPVLLVLVRWWRDVVFQRAERIRKQSTFERWVLANRSGWKSFLAATAGGVYLFVRGTLRATRSWVGRFNVTRRALAYLFRRELGKLEAERAELVTAWIPDPVFDALGPDAAHDARVELDVDADVERLRARLHNRTGGIIAVIGHRGMGKSTLLRKLHHDLPDTLLIEAPPDGTAALGATLARALGLAPEATLQDVAREAASSAATRAILLDDAQRFVQPIMGGLAGFDALLAAASAHCTTTTWVFALDEVLWLFLQRARGTRPLFDDVIRLYPWREEQIIELLRTRTAAAGVTPTFERLLEKLPTNADEIDRQEALERRASSYYRLLWDYAAGNPGVALHMWRRSLGADANGETHVRFFQAPDVSDLDLLPDPAVFALRAVLQMAPATATEVRRATMLSVAEVADALRYAHARGYIAEDGGRYTITWTWLRAISLFLQRRHLLVTS